MAELYESLLASGPGPILRKHPLTGEPIEPIWVSPSGKVCWPMMGAAPDDDDKDDKDDDDTGDSGTGDDDTDDDEDTTGGGDSDETVSKADYDALLKRMKAADKRAADFEARLKKVDDAKKDDLTKTQDRVTELEQENTELKAEIKSLVLNNAFLSANKHDWHDAETALDIAERKGFLADVMSEEGEVDKKELTKALDKLASEHKYLVKSGKQSGGDDDGPSGDATSGRSKNSKDKKAREQQLKNRFPSLNR